MANKSMAYILIGMNAGFAYNLVLNTPDNILYALFLSGMIGVNLWTISYIERLIKNDK